MKKLLVFLCIVFVCAVASATTVNIDWLMDGSTYAQTTCETGGNFTLPSPTPTKYGYHFVGWQQNDAIGSWSQSGIPTPTNPIYPTFKQFGNTVLRAVGSGDNFVADSYDPTTGKITRRVGVKVLDGTENWGKVSDATGTGGYIRFIRSISDKATTDLLVLSNAFESKTNAVVNPNETSALISGLASNNNIYLSMPASLLSGDLSTTEGRRDAFNNWLADQYANGTPVTVYYPLAEPVEENYSAQ